MKSKSKVPVALGVIIAALLGGLIAGQIQNRGEKSLTPSMGGIAVDQTSRPDLGSGFSSDSVNTELSKVAAPAAVPETAGEVREREAFIQWRKSEAAKLDATRVNEDLEMAHLSERIEKLTPTEWREAARQVLDTEAVANERVFSAYLVGQGGLSSTMNEDLVRDILSKPLPPPGAVHSLEETASLREKSLRLLVIDELIQQVKKDSSKRSNLDRALSSIADPGLRSLAMRRLTEEGLL